MGELDLYMSPGPESGTGLVRVLIFGEGGCELSRVMLLERSARDDC